MTKKTDCEFIKMLEVWAERYEPDAYNRSGSESYGDIQSMVIRLNEFAISRHGESQKLPSSVLSPV